VIGWDDHRVPAGVTRGQFGHDTLVLRRRQVAGAQALGESHLLAFTLDVGCDRLRYGCRRRDDRLWVAARRAVPAVPAYLGWVEPSDGQARENDGENDKRHVEDDERHVAHLPAWNPYRETIPGG
jgi:hypothetical protein